MLPVALGAATDAPTRVLALGCHGDDVELGCGGTLLRLVADRGDVEIGWVVLSGGDGPRAAEARASAEAFLVGCPASWIEVAAFRDAFMPYQGGSVKEFFEDVAARFRPDVVLTHWGGDRHQDHRLASELTWNTFRDQLILEYEIPKWDGDIGRPNVYVPLDEEHVRRKVDLLLEHFGSQRSRRWFTEDLFRSLARLRGMECNAPGGFAEAFHARKLALALG